MNGQKDRVFEGDRARLFAQRGLAYALEMTMDKKKSAGEAMDEWPLRRENPARRALREIGITHLRQLPKFNERELLRLHGVGPKAIRLLREALAQRGLAFAQPDSTSAVGKTTKRGRPSRVGGRK